MTATRRRTAQGARPGRRFLLIAVALSIAVHVAAALLVKYLPGVLPNEAQPQAEGTVELLLVEQKGAEPRHADQPQDPAQSHPPQPTPSPPKPREETVAAESPNPAAVPAPQDLQPDGVAAAPQPKQSKSPPAEKDAPEPDQTAQQPATPAPANEAKDPSSPRQPQNAPVFDFRGTESDTTAFVFGDHVVPAMVDDRFRNRPPVYPLEAEIKDEHGTVTIVIHVSENGTATSADVMESSGSDVLDEAALIAALKWHFHPAIKDGKAVPFRFIFDPS